MKHHLLWLAIASTLTLTACKSGGSAPGSSAASGPVPLRVIAINDFHGNLEAPSRTVTIPDPSDSSKTVSVSAGGVDTLAAWVQQSRAQAANSIVVSAGDLIGASPLISGMFHDEPTIEAMNLLGLELNAVGNHEFDHGKDELLRMQNGGCKTASTTSCVRDGKFAGAKFKFLAANVEQANGKTLFAPYEIRRYNGIPVAFIGMTLEGTPNVVTASGVAGLRFKNEVATVNALVPQLKAQGVNAIVVVVHEGGYQSGNLNSCSGVSGPIVDIVKGFDQAVDLVITGHTHSAYNCVIDGRPVTSAYQYGQMFSQIDLQLDPQTRDVVPGSVVASNRATTRDIAPVSLLTQLVDYYKTTVAPIANRIVGYAAGALSRTQNAAGESPLGDVIADAQLQATQGQGALAAFMNPGGIRADLTPAGDGSLTYNQLFTSQPFSNLLVTFDVTGAQLDQMLEQQFDNPTPGSRRMLQISSGFSYSYSDSAPLGSKVDIASIQLNGMAIDPAQTYRITANKFLADGGDKFTALASGSNRINSGLDIDALEAYLKPHTSGSPLAVPTPNRITRLP